MVRLWAQHGANGLLPPFAIVMSYCTFLWVEIFMTAESTTKISTPQKFPATCIWNGAAFVIQQGKYIDPHQ